MGFLGKLFGGKGSSSTAAQPKPAPVRNNTSSDSASDSEGPKSAFFGQHFEGLGDVWNAFFPGGIQEFVGKVQELFPQCQPMGPVMQRKDGQGVVLCTTPAVGGIAIHCNVLMKPGSGEAEFVGGYPSLAGIQNPCTIEQAHIWSNGISGVVAARSLINGAPLNFFLSGFFQHVPQMQFGAQAEFWLSALALSVQKQEQTEFSPEEGTPAYEAARKAFLAANPTKSVADFEAPVVSSHEHGVLLPSQVVGAWIYQVPVMAVEKVEFLGYGFRRIETRLCGVGDKAVFGSLYIAEHVLKGYEPQVGDDITGTLWMQGEMALDTELLEKVSKGNAPTM
ncbi:MAG: hypothetical protein IJ474_05215 [Mailhella sp.]|nr:hypothetical protein [Mailhella sp.]